jgi:hypothetical protein
MLSSLNVLYSRYLLSEYMCIHVECIQSGFVRGKHASVKPSFTFPWNEKIPPVHVCVMHMCISHGLHVYNPMTFPSTTFLAPAEIAGEG